MRQQSHATGRSTALRALAKPTALVLLLVLDGSALAAGNLFCCIDTNGKQVCGDLLPQACYGKAYREIGESGRTLRFVEAPLTAEQRAQRAIEEEKRKVEEEKRKEQRRKRLKPLLPRGGRAGAALLLIGAVEVFDLGKRFGIVDGGGELVCKLALLVDGFFHCLAPCISLR